LIRPAEFKAFPARTDAEAERTKMKAVCGQCHGKVWTDGHYLYFVRIVGNTTGDYPDLEEGA
jgi:cytochrome c553